MISRLRMGFRTKLWIALCGMVFMVLAVALLVAQEATITRARSEASARFERTLVTFGKLRRLRAELLAESIDALSRTNPQLRTILSTASLAREDLGLGPAPDRNVLRDANLRLQSMLPSLALHERLVVFAVASAHGELLYSKADPERYGQDLSRLDLLRSAAEDGYAVALWLDSDGFVDDTRLAPSYPAPALYLVRAEPVVFDQEIHGLVIAGEPIDRTTLAALREISGVEVLLLSGTRVLASTLSDADTAGVAARIADATAEISEIVLDGERFLALRAGVVPGLAATQAGFVLLSSLDAELAAFRDLRATLLKLGLAILGAALGIGFLLARGFTRPVAALADASRRVGAGELDAQVHITSGDEMEALGDAFNEMVAGLRERNLIKRTLERYVSKNVAAELLRTPDEAARSGVRRELTVLFVDLAGFTHLAESLAPEAVVSHLNEYFEAVCGAVLEENGTVKEFEGDGVVAFWGAPLAQPDHALRACRAALAASARLDTLCARWAERGVSVPGYRMGLHTDELVVGEIGSAERSTYGVVGDGMNLASRLEGANKVYRTHVILSETTRERVGAAFAARELDTVRVLGRSGTVSVFELVGRADQIDARTRRVIELYAAALGAYRARAFAEAERDLTALLALDPGDQPARVLLERVCAFGVIPPPTDWDGVFALNSK